MTTTPNTTASGAADLPEFPGHPEPHNMMWSALEIVAIRKYGADMFRAGRLAASAPVAPTKMPIPPSPADPLDVVYAEGWNAACEAFFGGKPPADALVITVAAPAPQPAAFGDEKHILVPQMLLGAACSAIDKKRDGTKVLEELRRYTVGDLSAAAPKAAPQSAASQSDDDSGADKCEEAFVRDFCPYKGSPDPLKVWRAAWKSALAAAPKADHIPEAGEKPAPLQQGAYLPLPECDATTVGLGEVWNRHSMRAYVDADRAARGAAQPEGGEKP